MRTLRDEIPWVLTDLSPEKVSACQEAFKNLHGNEGGWREFYLAQVHPAARSYAAAMDDLNDWTPCFENGFPPLPPISDIRFGLELVFDLELLPPDADLHPAASRVFGRPWMPEGLFEEVAARMEGPPEFMAQLNCAELSAFLPATGQIPNQGIIYIFSGSTEDATGCSITSDKSVVYYDGPLDNLHRIPIQTPCNCYPFGQKGPIDGEKCYRDGGQYPLGTASPSQSANANGSQCPTSEQPMNANTTAADLSPRHWNKPGRPFVSLFGFFQYPTGEHDDIQQITYLSPSISHPIRSTTQQDDEEDYDQTITKRLKQEGCTVLFQMAGLIGESDEIDLGSFAWIWAYERGSLAAGKWGEVCTAETMVDFELWEHHGFGEEEAKLRNEWISSERLRQ
ncbi:hypothetical protein HDV00_010464 [Rhizophlyctis rosea]|nr:hypothetical protein HDV00_010464 [Rhizophlyctis rosea]